MKVLCPTCNSQLAAPDTAAGKQISCPQCKSVMFLPDMATSLHNGDGVVVERAGDASSEPASNSKAKCDYCGEEINAAAKKCKHCGEFLDPALREAREAKDRANQNAGPGIIVVSRRPFPYHTLNIILSVLTCGHWLLVYLIWYLIWTNNYGYREI